MYLEGQSPIFQSPICDVFFHFSVTLLQPESENPCNDWTQRFYQHFLPTDCCPFVSVHKNMKSTKPNHNRKLSSESRRTVTGILYCMGFLVLHTRGVYLGIQGYVKEFTINLNDPTKSQLPNTSIKVLQTELLRFQDYSIKYWNTYAVFYSSFPNYLAKILS